MKLIIKSKFIFIIVLFCSCGNNDKFNGHVYDYDNDKPIENVAININGNKVQTDSTGYFCIKVKSNSLCKMILKKEGYLTKTINRTPDSLGKFSQKSLKYNRLYLFTKESDFTP